MDILPQLILIILLIVINAFFVASEFSLVRIRKTRIVELAKKNTTARLVEKSLEKLDTVISATQLGITLASLALGWIGEPALAHLLQRSLFSFLPSHIAIVSAHTVSVVVGFIVITFLTIILGELVPKSIALQKTEKMALIIIRPLLLFAFIFRPFIFLLNKTGNLIVRLLGFSATHEKQGAHSEEEIKIILSQSAGIGAIEQNEAEMVNKVFQMGDIPVQHIMVPRTEMVALNAMRTIDESIKKVQTVTFSRFPVFDGSIDAIIGLVHIKDLYKYAWKHGGKETLSSAHIIRNIISIPYTKRIDDILLEMKKRRIHMAVVNDEYGGTDGIVTLEDILEHLVGEIHDEFEQPMLTIEKQKDGSFLVDGMVEVDVLQQRFKIPIRGQGFTTIGGLVFGLLGREPKVGDTVEIGNLLFEVTALEGRRIKTVRMKKLTQK